MVKKKKKTRQGESVFKTWTAKMFYRILSRLTTIEIPLDSGDFRLFDKKVLDVIRQMPEKNKFLQGRSPGPASNKHMLNMTEMQDMQVKPVIIFEKCCV